MARKLKTYQTSLGFYDLALAAPSMKAALEAWGADSNLFHQRGEGKRRPRRDRGNHGGARHCSEASGWLERGLQGERGATYGLATDKSSKRARRKSPSRKPQKHPERTTDHAADRKAALAFEKEQERRNRERAKEEAARSKERERRQRAVDKAQSALDEARRKHEKSAADVQAQIEALEERSQAEEARWEKEKARLEAALRLARG
jgi:hypothetical protein